MLTSKQRYVVYGQKPLSEVEETPQIPGVPINA